MAISPTEKRLRVINQYGRKEKLNEFFELILDLDKIKNGRGSASVAPPSVEEIRQKQARLRELGEYINKNFLPGEIKAVTESEGQGSQGEKSLSALAVQAMKAMKKNRDIQDTIGTGINVLSNIIDLGIARSQIKDSERALNKLNKPLPPQGIQQNLNLQRAIAQLSGQATYADQLPEINTARQGIADTYQTQLTQSQQASGGQAGQFQAYAQAAANQRNRALTNLAGATSQARQGIQGQLNQLIGQQMGEERSRAYLDNAMYGTQLQQFNTERGYALQQGSIGRQNQRNAIFSLLGNVGGYLEERQYVDMDDAEYEEYFNELLGIGGGWGKSAASPQAQQIEYGNPQYSGVFN